MTVQTVLFGTESVFTGSALAALDAAPGIRLDSVVLAAPGAIPVMRGDSLARRAGPRLLWHDDDAGLRDRLAPRRPALLVVACYGRRLASELVGLAGLGVNLHPSLLPRYRGPDPLFWQLRAGETATGVSVHRLARARDAGDLVGQRPVTLPPGADRATLDALLAAEAVAELLAWLATTEGAGQAQDASRATRQGWPGAADRRLSCRWPVSRAWNFLRGAAPPGSVFVVADGDRAVPVRDAFALEDAPGPGAWPEADGTLRIGFADGGIRAWPARA